jgi:hypothetical protein
MCAQLLRVLLLLGELKKRAGLQAQLAAIRTDSSRTA